jgi:L-ascorbate metabolism protein UlaG (beta-lactamase superfamily)
MNATLQWFGTATWRLTVGNTVVWLDAYINRAPTAAPVPLRAEQVDRADAILIGHSHFDHIADAGLIARNTGARVIGSSLSCEIATDEGVDPSKVTVCSGGETVSVGPVTIHTFPSLHGFNDLREWPDEQGRDRRQRTADWRAEQPEATAAALAHLANIPEKQRQDGGPLAYLLEWDDFRLFWHDTPGMVTSSWDAAAELEPDLALLSVAAAFSTPNVDGQPFDGSHQEFVAHMATLLQPARVILNHHDDWCPPITYHLAEEPFRPGLEVAGVALEIRKLGETFQLD